MLLDTTHRKLSNISQTPIFQNLVREFEKYDFYADPLVDSIFPHNNVDSLIIQVVRTKLAKTYWNWAYRQELRYKPETTHLIDLAEELSAYLKYEFPGTVWFKGHYVCLLPNGQQEIHIDRPYWQRHAHRLVVPILTNPQAFTQLENESYHFEAGQLYEMNILRNHGSVNRGNNIRVHLFLDYVPLTRWPILEKFFEENTEPLTT